MSDQDSWDDEGPGSPSRASSPVSSHRGSEMEGSYVSEETEEEEIMSEFRELYKGVNSTTTMYNYSTESLDSSSFEDTEKLKARLHSLKRYVYELKESYDELLKAFSLLETGAKGRVAELERSLSDKINQAKDLCAQVESLHSQLSEAQSQISQMEETNQQLSTENSQLAIENRGLVEHVRDGNIEHYEQELSAMRGELDSRLTDLQTLRDELAALQGEHEGTLEELGRSRKDLENTQAERGHLQIQLAETQEAVDGLKEEVSLLTAQLKDSLDKQSSLSEALESTREAMDLYHTTARQEVEHKDQELAQLTVELSTLEQRRHSLEEQVTYSHNQVQSLEAARDNAQDEITSLQDEVQRLEEVVHDSEASGEEAEDQAKTLQQNLLERGAELEAVKEEKNILEKQLADKVHELQAQISHTQTVQTDSTTRLSDYQHQLNSLQTLHAQCQQDADKQKEVLEVKEAELSQMLTTLQVSAAQISALHPRDGSRSPGTVHEELSQCELACRAVERELADHRKKWEESLLTTEQHKSVIEELSSKHTELENEVASRERRVAELEAMLTEVNLSRESIRQTLCEYEESLGKLQTDLDNTRDQYTQACDEVTSLRERLVCSSGELEEKEQLLVNELQKRDTLIQSLETDEQVLKEKCEDCAQRVEATERAREALQQEYDRVMVELEARESVVGDLERRVECEGVKGRDEVERCSTVIKELKEQLTHSQQQCQASLDKTCSVEDELCGLREEHARVLDQLRVREDVLSQLEIETASLRQHHQDALDNVSHEQELVESLQEELASSQGLSDGLQQEVSECEREIQELQDSLHDNEQERFKLQEQVLSLSRDVDRLQENLSSERETHSTLTQTADSSLKEAQEELDNLKTSLEQTEAQQVLLEETCEQQRTEMIELRLVVSDLELQKENLLFQSSTNDGTIASLKSQLSTLEHALQDSEDKCSAVEEDLCSVQGHCDMLESQLSSANDKVVDMEHSKGVLEGVSSERLTEITHLHRQLEEERVREGLVKELGEQIDLLETQLTSIQKKHDLANTKALEADRSRVAMETAYTEQQILLSQLEQELERVKGHETEANELRDHVSDLEEQLSRVYTELEVTKDECLSLQSLIRSSQEKEHHWSTELSEASAELRLTQDRVDMLEREARESGGVVRELQLKLDSAKRIQTIKQEEVSDSRDIVDDLESRLSDKHQDILHLQHQLDCCRGDLDTLRDQLSSSEDARRQLLQRMGLLEEQLDSLRRDHCETEIELANARASLSDKNEFVDHLQTGYEQMTERVSTWTKDHKTSSEVLADKIREQESIISRLRSTNHGLEVRNDELSSANSNLRTQLTTDQLSSRDSSSTSLGGQPSITRLRAQVDVDISGYPGNMEVVTATVPITFDSQYRTTMEKGLSSVSGPPRYVGSETESEAAALDKDYWVKRAGELSVQLQQSSEYWTQKVRELAIELEKFKQTPRQTN